MSIDIILNVKEDTTANIAAQVGATTKMIVWDTDIVGMKYLAASGSLYNLMTLDSSYDTSFRVGDLAFQEYDLLKSIAATAGVPTIGGGNVVSVGVNEATAGSFVRDTSLKNIMLSDAGTLTDDGVLQVCTITVDQFIVGYGCIGWRDPGGPGQSAIFRLGNDAITSVDGHASFSNADVDAKMCVYLSGDDLVIKNRLGDTYKISYWVYFNSVAVVS